MGRRRGGRPPHGKGRGRGGRRGHGKGQGGGGHRGGPPRGGGRSRRPPPKREPRPEPPPLPSPGPGPTREELERATRALPIYEYEDEIVGTIRDHRVVVVEGPTGSGKTTQLPRMLLRAGIGAPGILGVTQPRRIAAVSVAWRIAQEEGVELGHEVGYAIRFDDQTAHDTRVKIMTDGLLLQEAHSDADFSSYGLVMVDEAHERSLNIDFTLGLLHRALSRRDDLKVIVSSATLRPELFQEYFKSVAGDVPLLHIQSAAHPVTVRYRPPPTEHPEDVAQAVADEVVGIHRRRDPGHVLAFLTGEGMIRDAEAQILRQQPGKDLLVLPLYGRLTREEQERVFLEWPGRRKVVLATNIAETSITIPDVRHILDTGLAKVPRVNPRTGITTLHAEGISQASAAQRAGRAGRTAPGEAVRLYAKHDLDHRPEYTDEEILRLDLTAVVLRLIDLGIHDVEDFPFPTPPPRRRLKAALRTLKSMHAIDGHRRLTDIGRRMVPFPADPPLARMIVEAADRFPEAVDDVLVVAAFLSGRPPYLFPPGEEQEARAAQERLAHPLGDHTSALNAYRRWAEARDREAFCEREYLDPNAMAFMEKAHEQYEEIAESLGIQVPRGGGDPEAVVRCVAAGFADRIMAAKGRDFEGPGGVAVGLHPGSVLFGERHQFIVATEIVDTRRPWARAASVLQPDWIRDIDPELARSLGIRKRRSHKRAKVDLARVPSAVRVGSEVLPVTLVRGEPRLEIRVDQVPGLLEADVTSVPADQLSYRARLAAEHHLFAQGVPLGIILAMLPYMPLPAPGAHLDREVPQGILMEADRNLHELGRWFHRLLTPSLPHKGKRPGWLTLVANGAGGYWFEVLTDFKDALETTSESLEDLAEHIPEADPLQERITEVRPKVDDAVHGMHQALGSLPSNVR